MASKKEINPVDMLLAERIIDIAKVLQDNLKPGFDEFSYAPWSVSRYKTLDKCPFSFYLRYVIKLYDHLPSDLVLTADVTDDSVRTDIGTLAHNLLEVMLGEDLSYDEAVEKCVTQAVRDAISPKYWDMVKDLREPCLNFISRMKVFSARYEVDYIKVEQQMGVDRNWKKTSFFSDDVYFRALIDYSVHMKNGDVLIIDHKLGGDPSWGLRNYQIQLDSYSALAAAQHHDGVNRVIPGIHFIQADDMKMSYPVSREEAVGKIPNQINVLIENAVDYVKEEAKHFPAVSQSSCKYCEVRDLCKKYRTRKAPAGLLQPILERTAECLKKP